MAEYFYTLQKNNYRHTNTNFPIQNTTSDIPTNNLLHIYNIQDNPYCDQCPNSTDTLEHALHLCPRIIELWYDIADLLSPEIDLFQYINSENVILGIYEENKPLENTIILAIKRYIYISKCKQKPNTLIEAMCFLKHIMTLEINVNADVVRTNNIQKWLLVKYYKT